MNVRVDEIKLFPREDGTWDVEFKGVHQGSGVPWTMTVSDLPDRAAALCVCGADSVNIK